MTQEVTPKRLGSNTRLALGLLLGFTLGLAVGIFVPRHWQGSEYAVVVQKGVVSEATGISECNVFYPRPFASPPNLKVLPGGLPAGRNPQMPTGFSNSTKITEQRADGFRISITAWVQGGDPPEYEAHGLLAKRGH